MNPSSRSSFVAIAALACFVGVLTAQAVTITTNSMVSKSSSSAGTNTATFTGTGIPTSQAVNATSGAFFANTQVDYTGSGDQVTLLNTFDDKRAGLLPNYSSAEGQMLFTVGTNTTYSLSGEFADFDATTAGYLYFESFLRDVTASTTLVYSNQSSKSTLNESYILGGSGGDYTNLFSGALTGSLLAGHQYQWYFYALTQAYPDSDGGATASGFVKLEIGGGAPGGGGGSSVPDNGSTIALVGAALLCLGLVRRKLTA